MVGWSPSLLPSGSVLQGVSLGKGAAVGYGLGATIGALARGLRNRKGAAISPPVRTFSWIVVWLTVAGALLSGMWLSRSVNAQADQLGVPQYRVNWWIVTGVGLAVAIILVVCGRLLRRFTRRVAGALTARDLPRPAALGVAFGVTTASTVAVVLFSYIGIQQIYNRIDATTTQSAPPTSPSRSGSPESLIPFTTLGKEGRQFVTQGSNSGSIRAYAGLQSADDAQQRAELAVADMLRAGGDQAPVWVGITTTGNGFIDPAATAAVDEVTGGRAALVAIQYSTLPSWLSFLVNQSSARDAGMATYAALAEARDRLPADQRPRLVLYGESLGAFGSPAPFAGMTPAAVAQEIDGALWVGPPAATDPVTGWTYQGTPPVWQPIVDGGHTVRYAASAGATDAPPGVTQWDSPRILVLQNPTDPVVWFTPELITRPATWLADPRGPGVQSGTRWVPLLFFLQTAMDLPQAVGMPSGYGHNYSDALVAAWRQVLESPA